MLNLVPNISGKLVRNPFLVKSAIGSVKSTTWRPFSLLSNTQKHKWNQLQLRQIPSAVCLRCSFYSTDPPNDDNEPKVDRMLPKLINDKIVVGPPFFSFFKITFKSMKIRNTFDSDFTLDEFVDGSKKAVEVYSSFRFQLTLKIELLIINLNTDCLR